MFKRGQVSVFIILGILILLVFGSILFLVRTFQESPLEEQSTESVFLTGTVENYIQSCVEDVSQDGIQFLGKNGGYYNLPLISNYSLPYYFIENKSTVISPEELQTELAQYINHGLFFCLHNFEVFDEQGYDIVPGEINTNTRITNESVQIDIQFPVTIARDSYQTQLTYFTASLPSRIGLIHSLTTSYLQEQELVPSSLCLSCLSILASEHGLNIELIHLDEDMMYRVLDQKSTMNNKPYEFMFLTKYQFQGEKNE